MTDEDTFEEVSMTRDRSGKVEYVRRTGPALAPLTLERIEELREAQRLGGKHTILHASGTELLSLLDSALALARLEAWLRHTELRQARAARHHSGNIQLELTERDEYESIREGPTIAAAINAALDQAEGGKTQ